MEGVEAVPFPVPKTLRSNSGGKKYIFHGKCYYGIRPKDLPPVNIDPENDIEVPGVTVMYLRCATRFGKCKCYASVEIEENEVYTNFRITEGSAHTVDCPWSPMTICLNYFRIEMFEKLRRREIDDPKEAYTWALNKFGSHYPQSVAQFPKFETSLRSTASRIRLKRFPPLPNRANLHDMIIPPALVQAKHRNNANLLLLQFSYMQNERHEVVIVLASRFMFEKWCKSRATFCDGTYKTCPGGWYQMYIMHTVVMGRVRPALICLMTRKDTPAYTQLFSRLRDLAVEYGHPVEWTQFHCDFESAVVNTIEDLFPQADILGCWFHFSSAIFKKMNRLIAGASVAYNDETTGVKTAVKQCFALAFVNPAEDRPLNTLIAIMNEYHELPVTDPPRPNLVPLFTYILILTY